MDEHFFDDLAKGLDDGTVSRGRALKLVGAALLSSALMPLVARPAEASLKRKCHRKGGLFASRGDCHCAWQCGEDITQFTCLSNPNCTCYKTPDGKGFCGTGSGNAFCTKNSDCTPPRKCALHTCSGGLCIAPCPPPP